MRSRVLALSLVAHAIVLVIAAAFGGGVERTPPVRDHARVLDVALVTPPRPTAPRQPAVYGPRAHQGGGAPRAIAPPRRIATRRAAVPPLAPATPAVEPASAVDGTVDHGDGDHGDGDHGDGEGGWGTGSGTGSGSGSGATTLIDRSSPPIPLDTTAAQTLPYTAEAARAHVTGDVRLRLSIDSDGRVASATIRSSLGFGLDDIAIAIAKRFTFHPARDREGRPTSGTVGWRFHFAPP